MDIQDWINTYREFYESGLYKTVTKEQILEDLIYDLEQELKKGEKKD